MAKRKTPAGSRTLLKLPLPAEPASTAAATAPALLRLPGSRADGGDAVDLVPGLKVTSVMELAAASRSDEAPVTGTLDEGSGLLALEAEDGTTIFIRADALAEQLARTRPELVDAQGAVDFAGFRDAEDSTRGALGWIWRRVSRLSLPEDAISKAAKDKAREWLGGKVEDWAVAWASRKGATALMAMIEERLAGEPGLYPWDGGALRKEDRLQAGDRRLSEAAETGPLLIFIHGTGSHTLGGFGDLPGSTAWSALKERFGERIFGYEHRTFSQSPIDNALALVETLPERCRINLVTHSRGGLVGDLLCLDGADGELAELIEDYRSASPLTDDGDADAEAEAFAAGERDKLGRLAAQLVARGIVVERYVRVAAPARGTALLSDNLDVFLSGLLNLVRRAGAWSVGAAVGALAPAAAVKAKEAADGGLKFLARIVLEIADKRLQPQVVPGIEAMLPEAPMGMLLGRARIAPQVRVGVIAGDIEGGGVLQRIGVMFVDWALFDRARNDLVVDTDSMYGGLVARAASSDAAVDAGDAAAAALLPAHRAIFVQGAEVNHFRYFRDDVRRDGVPLPAALAAWLAPDADGAEPRNPALAPWAPLTLPVAEPAIATRASRGEAEPADNTMPVLVFLPGIMGSHLSADGRRIWLDPIELARGRLVRIAIDSSKTVQPAGLVGMAYGRLAAYLESGHRVIRHDYDWRQPIEVLGKALAVRLREALEKHPDQPVRILAHSMGGLVVRAAFAADPELWPQIAARPGAGVRLLMLGTPNQGSHLFVETLLGQSDTIRMLARLDLRQGMQAVLDIVAGFPGAAHLLPAPDFVDTGGPAAKDYYRAQTWSELAAINNDFWFGRRLAGKPNQALLDMARGFWKTIADTRWVAHAPERIAYVFGKADNTPCGLLLLDEGSRPFVRMRGTPHGDGSVTWASGRLPGLPDERCWYMAADHMGLTSTTEHFADIDALLVQGTPRRLGRLPVSRSDEAREPLRAYRAGPPPAWPTETELVSRALGGRIPALPQRRRAVLRVGVKAMNLRFVQVPVLCGHYRGDPIAGAEAVIDRWLVDGALSQRQRLGIHSGDLGDATVVLMPRTAEERVRGTGRGAVVVGLGEMGKLGADGVTEAVRAGALRYLLHASDRYGEDHCDGRGRRPEGQLPLRLASLLVGTNSAASLDIAEAVKAVVRGVLLANRDYAEGAKARKGPVGRIVELELIELYRDAAISAAYAVSELNTLLAAELERLGARLDLSEPLQHGEGVRQRLIVSPFGDYWPRLSVSDADRDDSDCSAECWLPRLRNPMPPEVLRRWLSLYGCKDGADAASPLAAGEAFAPVIRHAQRFRFTFMGEKARAEVVVQTRQPGLIERLADEALTGPASTRYRGGGGSFGHTLFQLLVPVDFKAAARKANNLILVVDESTANLPWELLEDDGEPLVIHTRVVRQFMTRNYRRDVVRTDAMTACVIANPSTEGYYAEFGGPGWKPRPDADGSPRPDRLPSLGGAAREGEAVLRVLEGAGYTVSHAPPDARAGDVYARLFARPCRVLVIAAHGIHARRAADGSYRSGVVLSDGLLLSAAEIGLMETVPDLVFLSCCHLGKVGTEQGGQRLAASLARELIDMGVRCVVAAGWEVRDDAALTFSEHFFKAMAVDGARFGDAIHAARCEAYRRHPDCNTWGAYQAYGDPAFQLRINDGAEREDGLLLAPEELLDWLDQLWLDGHRLDGDSTEAAFRSVQKRVQRRLGRLPAAWAARPDVQQALGRLYAAYGDVGGFEAAREPLLRAVAEDSSKGVVPIAAIEQLANIEARLAEQLSQSGAAEDLERARGLVDDAIARMRALIMITGPEPVPRVAPAAQPAPESGLRPSAERQAILGSACKRRAMILLRGAQPPGEDIAAAGEDTPAPGARAAKGQAGAERKAWAAVRDALRDARDAYALGEGDPAQADWDPYTRINRLQLDWLLGEAVDLAMLEQCQAVARKRFERRFGFFDGIMVADCAVTRWLIDGVPAGTDDAARMLARAYQESAGMLAASRRQMDSVVRQLKLLAEFLELRADAADAQRVAVLRAVAKALGTPAS
ncbi:MAG TPA: CHAT domain-containing protein [Thauera sp.]|nr:CHAT domain-containing protein [Thauera sp.]